MELIQLIESLGKPMVSVYGNIDGADVKGYFKEENQVFRCEDQIVLMRHIAGYPGRYNKKTLELIKKHKPNIVVTGHSHILKVIRDKNLNHLHLNPGAAGIKGFHKVRTMLRFKLDNGKIFDMDVIELASKRLKIENNNEQ